jgi:hypothetical protein
MDGTHKTIESLARSAGVDPKVARYSIRMAFLAPDITKAILEGDHIPGIRFKDFTRTLPLSWSMQRRELRPDCAETVVADIYSRSDVNSGPSAVR